MLAAPRSRHVKPFRIKHLKLDHVSSYCGSDARQLSGCLNTSAVVRPSFRDNLYHLPVPPAEGFRVLREPLKAGQHQLVKLIPSDGNSLPQVLKLVKSFVAIHYLGKHIGTMDHIDIPVRIPDGFYQAQSSFIVRNLDKGFLKGQTRQSRMQPVRDIQPAPLQQCQVHVNVIGVDVVNLGESASKRNIPIVVTQDSYVVPERQEPANDALDIAVHLGLLVNWNAHQSRMAHRN